MEDFPYLIHLIRSYGYFVVGIGIFLECMGIPFPGETVLILGGVAASLNHLNLAGVIIVAILAAVMGDNLGYIIGKKFGRKILKKFENFPLFHFKHVNRAELFFKRHGAKTVFIGRFTAILRTYAAMLSGVFNMNYSTFFFYNLTGGIAWATIFGFVGYSIGNHLDTLKSIILNFNLLIMGLVGSFVAYKLVKIYLRKRKARLETENPAMVPNEVPGEIN